MRYNWTFRRTTEREGAHPTTGHRSGAWAGLAAALTASTVIAAFAAGDPAPPPRARLATISAKAAVKGASVLIEATEPVAYVTSRPDPLTVLVDLRNVTTAGVANRVSTSAAGPVAAVTFEDARASDGAPVARVRVLLAAPSQHQVHSDRNLIQVDVVPDEDAPAAVRLAGASPTLTAKGSAPAGAGAVPAVKASTATRLEGVRTTAGTRGVEITLAGNGALVASSAEFSKTAPHKLVLDFAGVAPAVPPVVAVGKGGVDRVRVAAYSAKPPVTRVVIDLARPVAYTMQPSGNELKVSFADGAAAGKPSAPIAAPATPDAADAQRKPEGQASKSAQAPPPAPKPAPVPPPPAAKATVVGATPAPQASGAAQQAVLAQSPAAQQPAGRTYSGTPVSLDFQQADLRSVLRAFAEPSGLNLVIDPAVVGSVDVTLRDVPWDQALDNILRANKLGYVVDGTIVRVAPLTVLAEEETSRRKLSEEQALSGELKMMTKTLSYAQAVDLEPLLRGNALSNRGTTAVDRRTNTIVLNDLPSYLAKAEALLNSLDLPEGQVEIEARIVSTSKTFARELGLKWGFTGQMIPELGNTTGVGFPNSIIGSGGVNPSGKTSNGNNFASLSMGAINGAFNLDVALQALENNGKVKVLLQPRVVTQNNVKARIARGQEIPYTTTVAPTQGSGTNIIQPMPTVQFKTAALTLEVTPRITPSDTVLLEVDVDNGSAGETQANGNVAINTQRATTKVLVQNGATTVIGGIYATNENRTDYGVPALSKIPLLGWLFRSETIKDTNEELLIFITPRVIRLK